MNELSPTETAASRIPFRLRIGVTGHRSMRTEPRLLSLLQTTIDEVMDTLVRPEVRGDVELTGLEFAVVSQLAEGADRLVVAGVLEAARARGKEAKIEVVLPMPRQQYVAEQRFDDRSKAEFDRLVDCRNAVRVFGPLRNVAPKDRSFAYMRAGKALVNRCDVLIAMWDGGHSGGVGGTAETLLRAAAKSKPCYWVSSTGSDEVVTNLDVGFRKFYNVVGSRAAVPEDRLPPFEDDLLAEAGNPSERSGDRVAAAVARLHRRFLERKPVPPRKTIQNRFAGLRRFNAEALRGSYGADYLRRVQRTGVENRLSAVQSDEDWSIPVAARASVLSRRYQQIYRWSTRGIAVSVVGAATMLAAHVSISSNAALAWGEAAFLVASTAGIVTLHKADVHKWWISYRVLAERLRWASVLGRMRVHFARASVVRATAVEPDASAWLLRAFDEVWQRRPNPQSPPQDTVPFGPKAGGGQGAVPETMCADHRQALDKLISGQLRYHRNSAVRHEAWFFILNLAILSLVAGTVLCAALDGMEVARRAMTFLLVMLPAVAASLEVLITVRQHRPLWERSKTMVRRLADIRTDSSCARSESALALVGVDAATILAEESEDWLGSLWFLDLEHRA